MLILGYAYGLVAAKKRIRDISVMHLLPFCELLRGIDQGRRTFKRVVIVQDRFEANGVA
jgi:hypothetical protein